MNNGSLAVQGDLDFELPEDSGSSSVIPRTQSVPPSRPALPDEPVDQEILRRLPPEMARQIGQEVLSAQLDPECYTEALIRTVDLPEKVQAEYARLRSIKLASELAETEAKESELDERRVTSFRQINGRRHMSVGSYLKTKDFRLWLGDVLFWHFLIVAASVSLLLMIRGLMGLGASFSGLSIKWQLALIGVHFIPADIWLLCKISKKTVSYRRIVLAFAVLLSFASMYAGFRFFLKNA